MSDYGSAAIDTLVDDMFSARTEPEDTRGYDEPDMPSDVAEVVGRLTPSPGADPDFGKSPRQIEREAEQQREEAGGEAKGCSLMELFGTEGLSDAQLGDLESERAYRQELAEEAAAKAEAEARIEADPEHLEFDANLYQQAEQRNAGRDDEHRQVAATTDATLDRLNQDLAWCQQRAEQNAAIYAQAEQAGDQARMQQCMQAAAEIQQRYAQAEQQRVNHEHGREVVAYVHQSESAFRQRRPDYDQAFSFIEGKLDELARQKYPDTTPEQHTYIKNVVQAQFADKCHRHGIDMAEAIYSKACELGYQSAGRPRASAPAQGQPQQPVQQSVQPMAMPSLAQIAEMDAGQFERFWSQFEHAGTVMPRGW